MTRGNTTSKQDIDRQITQKRKHCRTTRWKRPMNNTKCTTARNKIETTTDIMQWRRRQWHHWQSMRMTRTHTTKTTTVGAPPQTCKPFFVATGTFHNAISDGSHPNNTSWHHHHKSHGGLPVSPRPPKATATFGSVPSPTRPMRRL